MMIAYHRSIAWVVCAFNIMHQCTHLFINFESIEIWNLNEKTKTETNHGWLPTKQNENQKGDNENKTSETAILWFETSEERIYDRCDICRVVALVVVFASCQSRSWRRIESRKNLRGECWNFERKTSFFLFDCFACFFFKSKQNNNIINSEKKTNIDTKTKRITERAMKVRYRRCAQARIAAQTHQPSQLRVESPIAKKKMMMMMNYRTIALCFWVWSISNRKTTNETYRLVVAKLIRQSHVSQLELNKWGYDCWNSKIFFYLV